MGNARRFSGAPASLDYKRIIDQRCAEAKRKLVSCADKCLMHNSRKQDRQRFHDVMDEVFLKGSDELEALFPTDNEEMKRRYQGQMTRLQATLPPAHRPREEW